MSLAEVSVECVVLKEASEWAQNTSRHQILSTKVLLPRRDGVRAALGAKTAAGVSAGEGF